MALKLSQSLKQTQNLTMTPQLQQAIKLLTLTHLEMTNLIAEELIENPMLEEMDGGGDQGENNSGEDGGESVEQKLESEIKEATAADFEGQTVIEKDDFDWNAYADSFSSNQNASSTREEVDSEDGPNYENMITGSMGLAEHLQGQLSFDDFNSRQQTMAINIIHNLNEDGYLEISPEEVAKLSDATVSEVQDIREIIQRLDPPGCASLDLVDCLLSQARTQENRSPLLELVIRDHLSDLQKKDYQKMSKSTGATVEQIKLVEKMIHEFHPRPGRLVGGDDTQYVVPDIYVKKVGNEFVVQVNDDGVPRLRVSKMYQSMLGKNSDPKAKEFVQDKLRSAMWLIKSIQNRQKTIVRVAKAIVKRQQDFFKKGSRYLRPMILRDIAEEIGVHESTVSRVTTNKFLYCHLGVFELKFFFNAGVGGQAGQDDMSSEVLKMKIKSMVEAENPKRPLSDQKIVELLGRENIKVARRTVTKYREQLGIDTSARRKRTG